jgi:CubicO group peptidase (beta-lactamase class C family)
MRKMLALLTFFVSFFMLAGSLPVRAASKTDIIDDYILGEMKTGKVPGLSLGIVYGDKSIYLKGYGTANPSGSLVSAQTPFILGSVTKVITALAVRQLVNEGKLDYDTPVMKYIPWFTTADPSESGKMTIRDLLDHSSGFSTKSGEGVYTGYKYSLEQLVRQLDKMKLDRPAGSSVEYSNINYLVLGLVVQVVSGETYPEYIQKNIFDALEMKHSFTSEAEAAGNGLATGYRNVFGFEKPTHVPYPAGDMPYGFLISSAEDMTKLMICYLNNGFYQDESVIPDNSLTANDDPTKPYTSQDPYYSAYWEVRQGNVGYYGHSGTTVNYTSAFLVSQQSRYGIVILTNSSNDFYTPAITPDRIIQGVISILDGRPAPVTGKVHVSQKSMMMLALLLVLLVLIMIRIYWMRFFITGIRSGKSKRVIKLASMAFIDFIIPAGVITTIYTVMHTSISYALNAIPDQVIPVLCPVFILLIIGMIKVVLLARMTFKNDNKHIKNIHDLSS